MLLHFKEIGINPMDYNGIQAGIARASVINRAADYLMQEYFDGQSEHDCLFGVTKWEVNFISQIVYTQCAQIVYKPFH
jgi:hypothetical protein